MSMHCANSRKRGNYHIQTYLSFIHHKNFGMVCNQNVIISSCRFGTGPKLKEPKLLGSSSSGGVANIFCMPTIDAFHHRSPPPPPPQIHALTNSQGVSMRGSENVYFLVIFPHPHSRVQNLFIQPLSYPPTKNLNLIGNFDNTYHNL